jgi:hypothetical protein
VEELDVAGVEVGIELIDMGCVRMSTPPSRTTGAPRYMLYR